MKSGICLAYQISIEVLKKRFPIRHFATIIWKVDFPLPFFSLQLCTMAREKWEIVGENIFVTILPTRDNMIIFVITICEFIKGTSSLDKEEENKDEFGL